MNRRCGKILRRPARKALTLVESLAGTALLGTLLASIMVAGANFTLQAAKAQRRVEACRLAQEFMQENWGKRSELAAAGEGPIPRHDGWRWRARVTDKVPADDLRIKVLSLEFLGPQDEMPSAQLEMLLGAYEPTISQGPDAR